MSAGRGSYRVANRRRLARQRRAALERARALQTEIAAARQRRAEQERQRQQAADRARTLHTELVEEAAGREALSATAATGERGGGGRGGRQLPPPPADSASTDELLAWVAAAQPVLAEISQEVATLRSERHAADLAARLRAIAGSGTLATPYEPAAPAPAAPPAPAAGAGGDRPRPSVEELASRIEQIVSRLDDDATDEERARVDAAARAVVTETGLPPETLLTELKVLVQRTSRAAAARRRDRRRAEALLARLDGLVGAEVDDLRALLGRVVAGRTPLRDVDEARVATARARAIAEEDQAFVAEQLAATLAGLGYEVGRGFVRDLSTGSPAYAVVAASPGHAAELRLDGGRYEYRLVHTDPSADTRRDADVERDLCKAIGQLTAGARQEGVTFTLDTHRSAGAEPVPYVPAAGAARQPRRAGGAAADRERER